MRSIELFAGAGGLALGVAFAGFKHEAVIERDKPTYATLCANQQRGVQPIKTWPVLNHDVRHINYAEFTQNIELLAGGPPCQPFSLGGKHAGYNDQRDMFPEAIRAVRELKPQVFVFENVKGLLRQAFADYFHYIQLQLSYPEILIKYNENWFEHHKRIKQHQQAKIYNGLHYHIQYQLVNAADYGVAQRRERVFIVGVRSDLALNWKFPEKTHSHEQLIYQQWVTGEYWQHHNLIKPKIIPNKAQAVIKRIQKQTILPMYQPWQTIRDVICDLPEPYKQEQELAITNHIFRQGARIYKGHTGSLLDEPAKTLKAGDHGVPGGENMFVDDIGNVRYFTVRESARLQGFPDSYYFPVSWSESMRQLGNAVPVPLAQNIAKSLSDCLQRASNATI